MTEGTLAPAYIEMNYHSAYGTHKALIGTKEWFPTDITGNLGSYENWNTVPIDAETMIRAYATEMMKFYPATAGVDTCVVWTKDTPTSPARPRKAVNINVVGIHAADSWSKAAMTQWIFRGEDYSLQKYVWLDALSGDSWDSLNVINPGDPGEAFALLITDSDQAFMTRKDSRPSTFIKITYKLNDALRHEYGMD